MKRLFATLSLLLISCLSWATTTDNSITSTSSFDPGYMDVSVSYLNSIFGGIGSVIPGAGGEVLGKMLAIFNEAIIVIGGLWVGYTAFKICIQSAQEGSFMGANKNVAMVFLKMAMGFALIAPLPGGFTVSGYSLSQEIIMKVVLGGVALADKAWSAALDYMYFGGLLYVPPVMHTINMDNFNKMQPSAAAIFKNEVCMLQSNIINQNNKKLLSGTSTSNPNSSPYVSLQDQPPVNYAPFYSQATQTILFPGLGDVSPFDPAKTGPGGAICCSIKAVSNTYDAKELQEYSWNALVQMVNTLLPAAETYVYCKGHPDDTDCKNIYNYMDETNPYGVLVGNSFMKAKLDYLNMMVPYARLNGQTMIKDQKLFVSVAKTSGWATAGRYYWSMAQINQMFDGIDLSNDAPTEFTNYKGDNPGLRDIVAAANDNAVNFNFDSEQYMEQYLSSIGQGSVGLVSVGLGKMPDIGAATDVLNKISLGITSVFNCFSYINYDPIVFLLILGHACLSSAFNCWVAGVVASLAIAGTLSWCSSASPGAVVAQVAVEWIRPVALYLAAGLAVPGFIFAFYLPLYPYLTFTFGVIGWLIIVLEAIVAAPLVAWGLTHPDNHDFLGRAEQGIMLALSVFLRPVLMVIGLIAAMIISYVSLRILNTGFGEIIMDVVSGFAKKSFVASHTVSLVEAVNFTFDNSSIGGGVLFVAPMLYIFFAMTVYTLTQLCYSLIYKLPNNIMSWIGAPGRQDDATGQMIGQLEQGTKSGASTLSSSVDHATRESSTSTQKTLGKFGNARAKKAQEKLKNREEVPH